MDLQTLKCLLEESWSTETSRGNWDSNNPALGQCAVTALLVQDYFGGELLRCKTKLGYTHYWNRLADGTEVDFTESQFEAGTDSPIKNEYQVRDRGYVLSFPDTDKRYRFLKEKIEKLQTFKESP